jgi:hypothetical protein
MNELSIAQIAAIKEAAERILLYYSEKDEIQKNANLIFKYLIEQPSDPKYGNIWGKCK